MPYRSLDPEKIIATATKLEARADEIDNTIDNLEIELEAPDRITEQQKAEFVIKDNCQHLGSAQIETNPNSLLWSRWFWSADQF